MNFRSRICGLLILLALVPCLHGGQQLTVSIPSPPSITSTSALPKYTQGNAYSFTFQATGCAAPYTWSIAGGSLPAGLALAATGILSGTPTASGSFSFSVAVTCGTGITLSLTQQFTLTSSHTVSLSWTVAPGAAGYNIYRGTAAGKESTTSINSSTITSSTFVDSGVTAGTTYYYVAMSVGSSGNLSAKSNEATATVPSP
jgi:large repetitive protein